MSSPSWIERLNCCDRWLQDISPLPDAKDLPHFQHAVEVFFETFRAMGPEQAMMRTVRLPGVTLQNGKPYPSLSVALIRKEYHLFVFLVKKGIDVMMEAPYGVCPFDELSLLEDPTVFRPDKLTKMFVKYAQRYSNSGNLGAAQLCITFALMRCPGHPTLWLRWVELVCELFDQDPTPFSPYCARYELQGFAVAAKLALQLDPRKPFLAKDLLRGIERRCQDHCRDMFLTSRPDHEFDPVTDFWRFVESFNWTQDWKTNKRLWPSGKPPFFLEDLSNKPVVTPMKTRLMRRKRPSNGKLGLTKVLLSAKFFGGCENYKFRTKTSNK